MTTLEAPRLLQNVWKAVLAWGALTLLLGVAILVWPGISIGVAAILFGTYLIMSGIAQVIFAFALEVPGGERVLLFISGALSLVLGVLAFRNLGEGYAILLLAIWIGASFIFQGVAETTLAITFKELPGRGWHIFLGILSVIAGMIVIGWPFDSIVMLAIVAGVWLVAIGITSIIWALKARKEINTTERKIEQLTSADR
ncbi:MAG: HdeD family acid-resistance protein [Mycobacterium sp.]